MIHLIQMGWAAATSSLDFGALALGAALFAWQFPHFNALAWNLRPDYSKAGYHMMSVTNPGLNARVALRYSLLMFPISFAFPYLGITSWAFASTSSLVNGYMTLEAFKFWRNSNDANARKLFFASLIHLPVFLGLLMFHKSKRSDCDNDSTTSEDQKD
jgi:protoheme IX farnesyltransferase